MRTKLTPLPEALAFLFERVPAPPAAEVARLKDALGRTLAELVFSDMDVPPFDNSAMDGYAVRAQDLPGTLPVSQRIPAGRPAQMLTPGSAARIFTGAVMPEGADAVVLQEDCEALDGRVRCNETPSIGQHIRRRGADIAIGSEIISAGKVLTSQDLGLLASIGRREVQVFRPLRVAVVTTGSELVEPGEPLEPWQIYNSNATQVSAQLRQLGMTPLTYDIVADDPAGVGDALEQAALGADCVITSGGVSVGEEDHVRDQIEARGELTLWKLAIKPGKPLAFGAIAGCPVFGLPGNPVSAWATFALVVKPWLMRAQGAVMPAPRFFQARCGFSVPRAGNREEYLRVSLVQESATGEWTASHAGSQSSGVLSSVSRSDGLARIPIGTTLSEGDTVEVLLHSELMSPMTGG